MSRPRGFTLIEVVIASTMILVISSIGMAVFLFAQTAAQEARVRAQMERDAQLIQDSIQRDLAYFGSGVPGGCNGDDPIGDNTATSGVFIRPAMRLGLDRAFAFVGDVPFPNSEFSGIATPVEFDSTFTGNDHRVAIVSEISGACVPPDTPANPGFNCDTRLTTLIPGNYTTAGERCTDTTTNARTCPWGMNKWPRPTATDQLFWTFVDPGGNWYERSNRDAPNFANVTIDNNWVGVHLSHNVGDPDFQGNRLFDNVGGAFIGMLDRVFWVVEDSPNAACTPTAAGLPGDCEVKRNQCWGRLDPNNAAFPSLTSAAFPNSTGVPSGCVPTNGTALNGGTGWETIATNVKDVRFRYFGSNATTPLAAPLTGVSAGSTCNDPITRTAIGPGGTKAQTRSVEVTVDLERKVPGTTRTVAYSQSRRFLLPSREVQ